MLDFPQCGSKSFSHHSFWQIINKIFDLGTMGATIVDQQVNADSQYDQSGPLVFSFGHKTPGHNLPYYNHLVNQMAGTIKEQLKKNRKAEASGVIINTCGWIKDKGYDTLKNIAQAFEVDAIIVIDEDRLYRDLVQDMPPFVKGMYHCITVWKLWNITLKRKKNRENRSQCNLVIQDIYSVL